jgi:CBS domain-containing protein
MHSNSQDLLNLTASDVMSRNLVLLPEWLPMAEAARLLVEHQVGGAPVVDKQGKCVGVLSATDFLFLAEKRNDAGKPALPAQPVTCSFQTKRKLPSGREITLCDLPLGACPIQMIQTTDEGEKLLICRQPHTVLSDWQVVKLEKLPHDEVRHFMTADPVTAAPTTPIRELARNMIDAHIHRVVIVDGESKPVGIVSSTDLLAAMAYAETPAPA